jgi:ferredoxin/flavodoxin
MNTSKIQLVYFSPTETTAKIVESIAEGIKAETDSSIDLTGPISSSNLPEPLSGDLTILGAPVYGGRIPTEAVQRLSRLRGDGKPAVVVVVYGNREFEDALLELRDTALECGFTPVAGGAFIGEHSFSSGTTPIAAGRPDSRDAQVAREFGSSIKEKLKGFSNLEDIPLLEVPGASPYKPWVTPKDISPATDETLCTLCKTCEASCPVGAVHVQDGVATNKSICILCSACVKKCPTAARTWQNDWAESASSWLVRNCYKRKEPEFYL